ncbi:uncharacterized protein LOC123296714 [Chrysoperla carnea]|uniref:uncharacterized protein LOC123296714 n=1 Tax=Chrysoperla carnea TaxID=189513 RepID=UPI001D07E9B6|nr:uncharacterized protein LOC123296714 [Chrysoperla carnea]
MYSCVVTCSFLFCITLGISQIVPYRDPKRLCEMGDADCFKKVCPTRANEVYDPCSGHCQPQCEMAVRPCKLLCMPGCACAPGYCRLGPLHYARSKCISWEAYSGGSNDTTANITAGADDAAGAPKNGTLNGDSGDEKPVNVELGDVGTTSPEE